MFVVDMLVDVVFGYYFVGYVVVVVVDYWFFGVAD